MQTSQQAVFNPVKLVESLRLRTTEQQDAQEYVYDRLMISVVHSPIRFSKLFMAHLDSEFQKQANPTLKSLVADQVGTTLQVDYIQWDSHHPSFKANKYIPLFVPSVITVLSVRASFLRSS